MSTKLKIIILLLFLVQGAVFYWSYSDKEQAEIERLKPYVAYFENPLAVKSIDLSHQNLTALAIDFSQFQNLEYLDLSYNQLEKIPKVLFDLPKLKTLNLSNNNFLGDFNTHPNSSIERLDLSNNELEGISSLICGIDCFESLKTINLNNNNFVKSPNFDGTYLDTILLKDNQLKSIKNIQFALPSSIINIVEHLDISNNRFEESRDASSYFLNLGYGELSELAKKCVSLDISRNYFERFPYEVFGNYTLKHLKINNCEFDDSKIIVYGNNLESLNLSNNRGNINGSIFETSQNLKELNLERTSVISSKLANETLEELYIEQINTINNLDFPNLKIINVDVHNQGIERLISSKERLPKLEKIVIRNYKRDRNTAMIILQKAFPDTEIIVESYVVQEEEVEEIIQEELLEENQ